MNDLRQQQVQVAATSSSVSLAATPLCSNSSNSSSSSASVSASVSPRSSSNSNSNSNSSIGSNCKVAAAITQQQQQLEEEEQQEVSSTSSPAEQQQQQLNVSPAAAAAAAQRQHQQQQHHTQQQQHQPVGQITSTTASPPQHRLRDDAQLPNSTSNISNSTAATAAAAAAAATTSQVAAAAMAATALDVNGEENNSSSSSSAGGGNGNSNSNSSSGNLSGASSNSSSGNHKIILKLSKHGASSNTSESLTVNDERRVEPLRIQLGTQQLPTSTLQQAQQQQQQQTQGQNIVPKLTIRPIKSQDAAVNSDASSTCSSSSCADEEQLPHIVPKLTIRAANEERVGSVVPKLIIKMPDAGGGGGGGGSVGVAHETSNCKSPLKSGGNATTAALPKLTIKTTKLDGNDTQLRSELSCSLSPASASSSSACSSTSCSEQLAAMPTVPKLMIKTTLAGSSCISSEEQQQQQQQLIPKLTIKTAAVQDQQQQQQHTVIMTHDAKNAQCIPKLTIKTKSIELEDELQQQESHQQQLVPKLTIKTSNCSSEQQPLLKLTIKNLCSPKHKMRAVLEEKLVTSKLTLTNGGEINKSNSTDAAANLNTFLAAADDELTLDEVRRNSDDMDIDDALCNAHDPQMFHNLPATEPPTMNGIDTLQQQQQQKQKSARQQQHNIVDMVDLTSSPSAGSSPAHDETIDAATAATTANSSLSPLPRPPNMLLECFRAQAAAAVAAYAAGRERSQPASPNSSNILLSQLTAPPKNFSASNSTAASKYPQLTERLMANGATAAAAATVAVKEAATAATASTVTNTIPTVANQSIIDSIEILDTPEGSPQLTPYMQSAYEPEATTTTTTKTTTSTLPPLTNHVNHMNLNLNHKSDNQQLNNNENHLKRQQQQSQHATDAGVETSTGLQPSKQRRLDNNENDQQTHNYSNDAATPFEVAATAKAVQQLHMQQPTHRSRKQKHERILNTELEEAQQQLQTHVDTLDNIRMAVAAIAAAEKYGDLALGTSAADAVLPAVAPTTAKRRGRPKRNANETSPGTPLTPAAAAAAAASLTTLLDSAAVDSAVKSRRVQLLRKRLAIDMVSADSAAAETPTVAGEHNHMEDDGVQPVPAATTPRRNVRATRRSAAVTPTAATPVLKATRKRQSKAAAAAAAAEAAAAVAAAAAVLMPRFVSNGTDMESSAMETNNNSNNNNAMAYAQIDLTMCSSSSSTSNGSATTTATSSAAVAATTAAIMGSTCSMLPPTTILSSSDPLPDVIFQPNDFSSIMATQQLRSPHNNNNNNNNCLSTNNSSSISGGSQQDDEDNFSAPDHSGDDESSPSQHDILSTFGISAASTGTPTRGRGRGRGSRGGSARSGSGSSRNSITNPAQPRAPRMSRGASAVAKAIAQSRPRCVGGLKHQPDPERLKGLFSPSPQVFEEDTRMSADLNNSNQSMACMDPPLTPQKQPDFLNNEESQSSMVSSISLMDSNQGQSVDTIIGSALKRPKKKKMEICVAEDTDFNAASIAEYDWPPPKGCCPSKNRDTFMIQEQVALYLGITSFKRKYPDLPRRAVDMEERNWLQEKGYVSEKMCDLGITAVWASDILDIMYADFYDKYEEYKEFIRQKHLRDIEAKQKALGLTVGNGRGLQARDRAMLSTSKWNVYFNKTRKEERVACLDLQTFTLNVPVSRTAPSSTQLHRSIVNAVRSAAQAENIPAPPNLLAPRGYDDAYERADYEYPLALVPGQFTSNYRQLTPAELRAYPLNTALDKPSALLEETQLEFEQQPTKSLTSSMRRSQRARHLRGNDSANLSSLSYSSVASSSSESSSSDSDSDGESDSSCTSSASSRSSCSSVSSCSSINSSSEADRRLTDNCGVCLRNQHRNAKDTPEAFIRCYSCRRKVHPSCIEMPQRMVGRVRNYNWQCAECKCCIKCRSSQQPGKMLYCEQCDRGYHIYCLGVKTVPDGRWSCERCSICMRCGATRPEGLPVSMLLSPSGSGDKSVKPVKHKKVKWMNEYRIDHITKLREHCGMLCVPCARAKPTKRTSPATPNSSSSNSNNNNNNNNNSSSNSSINNQPSSPQSQNAALLQLQSPVQANGAIMDATAALSPRTNCSSSVSNSSSSLSGTTAILMAPPVTAEANIAGATILPSTTGKRMQLPAKSQDIATMQCSSYNRNSNDEDPSAAATATITTTTTVTPAASNNNNNSSTTTTIGIAPPPVVA